MSAVLLARCENDDWRSDGTPRCTGTLRFRWGASEAACDVCGARSGVAVSDWIGVERSPLVEDPQAAKAASPDPGLLRWCRWPGCFEHFNAGNLHEPADRGWLRRRHDLLCPTHAPHGHWPGWRPMDGEGPRGIIAECTCGAESPIESGVFVEAERWWDEHVEPHEVSPAWLRAAQIIRDHRWNSTRRDCEGCTAVQISGDPVMHALHVYDLLTGPRV